MIDREQIQPNREYVDAKVGTTDQAAQADLKGQPPWYRQYLDEMKKRVMSPGADGSNTGMPTADDKLSPYRKLGSGGHNIWKLAAMADGGVVDPSNPNDPNDPNQRPPWWESIVQHMGMKGADYLMNNLLPGGIHFADGGAVQGPTLALIGEGGEPEYVVPQSKALPFAQHTMRTGNPPNPAKLSRTPKAVSVETVTVSRGGDPSTEGELPAEAEEIIEGTPQETEAPATEAAESDPILAAIKELTAKVDALAGEKAPAMAKGGKVAPHVPLVPKVPRPKVPHMADGGMVLPQYGPPKPFTLPPNPANPYTQPDLIMDAPPDLPVNSAAPAFPSGMPQLQRPTRPIPPRITSAADKYAAVLKAAPKPQWYDALMAQPNTQHYGTGKVESYGALGAGIRNTIGSLLPYNRKLQQHAQELEAAKAGMGMEKQANADAREETQLQAQMELNRARLGNEEKQGALYEKQAAKLDQPEKVKPSEHEQKLQFLRDNFPDATDEIRQQFLLGIKPDKPEADIETNDHKNYTLAMKDWPTGKGKPTFDEWLTADSNRKAPRISTGAGEDKLLTPAEAAMLGVPYGTTRAGAAGKQPASEPQKLTGQYATRIEQANKLIDELGGGQTDTVAGTLQGWAPNWAKSDDRQNFEQAERNLINAILRRESGAVISPSEFTNARAQYIPQPGDAPKVLATKKANRDLVQRNMIKASGNAYEPAPSLAPPTQQGGDTVRYSLNGKTYNIPLAENPAFLKDNPSAVKVPDAK